MIQRTHILEPAAPPHHAQRETCPLDSLAGKTIAFIDNAKPNFNHLVDALGELLVDRYKVAAVVKHRKPGQVPVEESVLSDIAARCDAVITGSGD